MHNNNYLILNGLASYLFIYFISEIKFTFLILLYYIIRVKMIN